MAFWDKWFKPSEEEQNKIKLRAKIQGLIKICNSLIEDLHAKLNQNKDKATQASIKKVRSQIQESLGHLEGADKSLNELNVELTIEELEEADKDINSKNLSDSAIHYLVSQVKILSKKYLSDISYIRTNIDNLIRVDLPGFKLK
ncbi:MAG: hypothetical protein QT11_C0001G0781 [archaeon GW2011_AR20]|nr:MAG: hypothetical protein QT11_C0001G0781 [archaeon GW2011_AR20]MBS3160807.1 hypothetical protein [Candidatus Woesearchaeota archaeon]